MSENYDDNKDLAFEVIVFGNRAVGKTSLLASMYMQMEDLGIASLDKTTFSPLDNEEFMILENKWNSLRETLRDNEFISAPVTPYEGTQTFVEHDFVFRTLEEQFFVRFVDTKGADTGELNSELISRINNSFMTLCVVDAAILMERDDIDNDKLNCPKRIKRILENVLGDGDNKQPRSCMFVLTKCEKYIRTPEDRERLVKRFEHVYAPVLKYAADKRYPLFYLPVQTMGCVEFSRIDPLTKEMKFKTVNKDFKPVDVIFPLAYLLKIFLEFLNILQQLQQQLRQQQIREQQIREQQKKTWLGWFKSLFTKEEKIEEVEVLQENFNHYYDTLKKMVKDPVDFRGNHNGTSERMESMNFWND